MISDCEMMFNLEKSNGLVLARHLAVSARHAVSRSAFGAHSEACIDALLKQYKKHSQTLTVLASSGLLIGTSAPG